ncbi:cyclase family protein, partial [Thermodesulfobacteriota bacterium]
VLVHTGWGRYFEKDQTKNAFWVCVNRPGLSLDGAEWLVKRKIKAYGQDTIGTHQPATSWFPDEKTAASGVRWIDEPVHQLMLGNDILLLEHLTNLDKVANRRIIAGFFPLPLKGTDGAPIRAVAFIED